VAKELVRELINAGVHFGHGVSRWNPKMAPFIFAKRSNIHIIDIKKTLSGMLIAKKLLSEVVASGRDVVFVGTKRSAPSCNGSRSLRPCRKAEVSKVKAKSTPLD
jgi:small subunit ribosomal protein S2